MRLLGLSTCLCYPLVKSGGHMFDDIYSMPNYAEHSAWDASASPNSVTLQT
eukprot:SAG11_NODE_7714_length_1105_cov_2.193837_2_plen_51_part_00